MTATREDVLKALDQVIDPVSGRTVVQQDMISGLVIRDGHVGFVLEVAKDRAAKSEPLRKICEAMALGVAGVKSVTAVLTAHDEHPHDHDHAPARPAVKQQAPPPPAGMPGVDAHHRGGQRQGRRGQIHRGGQPGAVAGAAGPEGGPAGCRHLWPQRAAPAGHHRQAGHRRQEDHADREIRHPRHVAGLPAEGRRSRHLARADGAVGADADVERCDLGHAGRRWTCWCWTCRRAPATRRSPSPSACR